MMTKFKLDYLIPITLITGIVLFNILLYFSHQLQLSWIFNSDVSYIPALYQDVFLNHGAFSQWHLTPAPYIFPDAILYMFILSALSDHYVSASVYFTLQSLLILHAVYLINRLYVASSISLNFAAIAFGFMFLFPSIAAYLLFLSAFHMGEFVISLYAIYLVLKIIKYKKNNYSYILLGIISALIILSDKLYLLHFVAPCMLTIGYLFSIKKLPPSIVIKISLILVMSIIVGYTLYNLLITFPEKPRVALQFDNFHLKFQILYELLVTSINNHFVHSLWLILSYVTCLIIVVFRHKFEQTEDFSVVLFLAVFMLMVCMTTLISSLVLLTDNKSSNITDRYMIIVFLLPTLMIPLLLTGLIDRLKRNVKPVSMALSVFLLLVLAMQAHHKLNDAIFYPTYYPEPVKCFDDFITQTQLHDKEIIQGAADYWTSKMYYVLSSHANITIAQYLFNLQEYRWITSEAWYQPQYDFFILNRQVPPVHRLNKTTIEQKYGKASKIFTCESTNILYYAHDK